MTGFLKKISALSTPFSRCNAAAILSPEGEPAQPTFVTFYRWVHHLESQPDRIGAKLISAAFGKPTAPVDPEVLAAFREYWKRFPDAEAIQYGNSSGDWDLRALMAEALEMQYHNAIKINPEHVIFTVGGCGALQAAFAAIHQHNPAGKLAAVSPYYPQYQVLHGGTASNSLHPIDVTKTGFRLTAEALKESLAKISEADLSAFVFCDPNNPCGTTPGMEEWRRISQVLKNYSEAPILLDEAYAEMHFKGAHRSLLEAAPELASRVVLIRSATKGLSAAGERMAAAVVPDKKLRSAMLDFITNISLHAPKSHQYAYTRAMRSLTEKKQQGLATFYEKRLAYMIAEFKRLGIQIKDPFYKPDSTFYVLADLSGFKGRPLHPEAARILGKADINSALKTDQEIAYHLLFAKSIAIAPLSFFGIAPESCQFRITCSDEIEVLEELIRRLSSLSGQEQND